MSSHADTIRQRLAEGEGCISSQFVVGQDEDDELGREFDEARAALDALLAENQQLREALAAERAQRKWAFQQLRDWWLGVSRGLGGSGAAIRELDRVEGLLDAAVGEE